LDPSKANPTKVTNLTDFGIYCGDAAAHRFTLALVAEKHPVGQVGAWTGAGGFV
jgi:hypothetical protein